MQKLIQLIMSLVSIEQIPIKSNRQCEICVPKLKKLLYGEIIVITVITNILFKLMEKHG